MNKYEHDADANMMNLYCIVQLGWEQLQGATQL